MTAGRDLVLDGSTLSAERLLVGSHSSDRSPGQATLRGATIKAGGDSPEVHIYADGGVGSMVDLTGSKMKADPSIVLITADTVMH